MQTKSLRKKRMVLKFAKTSSHLFACRSIYVLDRKIDIFQALVRMFLQSEIRAMRERRTGEIPLK